MSITPVNAKKTVTTAGTRVQLNATANILPTSIYIEALGANTGYIYVGLITVSSTVYMTRLAAGEGYSINSPVPQGRQAAVGILLSSLWIDSSVNGEGVQVTYIYSQS